MADWRERIGTAIGDFFTAPPYASSFGMLMPGAADDPRFRPAAISDGLFAEQQRRNHTEGVKQRRSSTINRHPRGPDQGRRAATPATGQKILCDGKQWLDVKARKPIGAQPATPTR